MGILSTGPKPGKRFVWHVDDIFGEPMGLLDPYLLCPWIQSVGFFSVADVHSRESSPESAHNLQPQREEIEWELLIRGVTIRHRTDEIHSARTLDRPQLKTGLKRSAQDTVPLVFRSRPRLIHGRKFNHTFKSDKVHPDDAAYLAECGAICVTVDPPDAPLTQVRSAETKRGMRRSSKQPGRPRTETTKRDALIVSLASEGQSVRAIGQQVGLSKSRVHQVLTERGIRLGGACPVKGMSRYGGKLDSVDLRECNRLNREDL